MYELGNGQWDIPGLRQLLEEVIPKSIAVEGSVVAIGLGEAKYFERIRRLMNEGRSKVMSSFWPAG